jgi:NTP pyrophosphatase (non-canonical NTP hydrolase)
MPDLPALTQRILAFRDARDWARFHTPRNLAASLSIEAAELLEVFQWDLTDAPGPDAGALDSARRERIAEELADIGIYALLLAHETGIDLTRAIEDKIEENERKYPVEKAKGRSAKYTEF